MIAGILRPDAGSVEIGGDPIDTSVSEAKRRLGFVPQDIALFDDLSALENLRFFGGLQGLSGRELASRVAATLDLVGLADRAGDRVIVACVPTAFDDAARADVSDERAVL